MMPYAIMQLLLDSIERLWSVAWHSDTIRLRDQLCRGFSCLSNSFIPIERCGHNLIWMYSIIIGANNVAMCALLIEGQCLNVV